MTESKEEDEYAQLLKRQCIVNLFLQSKSARINNTIQSCLTLPNIVIGAIMSISIFSTSSEYWRITSGALAIASTVLTSLSKQLGAGEKAQLHCAMVRQYTSLIQELTMFIHINNPDPEHRRAFMERIRQQINKLVDMQPEPNYFAVRLYEGRYKKRIEEALFDDLETAAMQNATYVEMRLSRTKPTSTISTTST